MYMFDCESYKVLDRMYIQKLQSINPFISDTSSRFCFKKQHSISYVAISVAMYGSCVEYAKDFFSVQIP